MHLHLCWGVHGLNLAENEEFVYRLSHLMGQHD